MHQPACCHADEVLVRHARVCGWIPRHLRHLSHFVGHIKVSGSLVDQYRSIGWFTSHYVLLRAYVICHWNEIVFLLASFIDY